MPKEYPWYDIAESTDPLEQGDLIDNCPVFVPDYSSYPIGRPRAEGEVIEVSGEWLDYDVVVLSQSCDLAEDNLDYVVVCPHNSLDEYGKMGIKRSNLDNIRKGYMPAYHMLHSCKLEGWTRSVHIVDFGGVYTIPFGYLKQFVAANGKRLRLNPPYREHLSQAYARYFMRVGLPQGIPKDEVK